MLMKAVCFVGVQYSVQCIDHHFCVCLSRETMNFMYHGSVRCKVTEPAVTVQPNPGVAGLVTITTDE